jgi:NADH dehydrogenase
MRIVVSGGTGFIGGAVVAELRRRGHDAVAGSRHGDVRLDVADPDSLRTAFAGAGAVVNAVQFNNYPIESSRQGRTFDEVDRRGTERQVEAAQAVGVGRFLYVSGVGADVQGRRHWFRAKGWAETAVGESGLSAFVLRPSWVYGPADQSLNRLARIARRSPLMPVIGNGRQALEPVFVDDVAWAVGEAVDRGVEGTYEIGGPERLTMDDVVRAMLRAMGKRRPLVHVPAVLPQLAARLVLSKLPGPPLTADAVEFLVHDAVADTGPLLAAMPGLPRTTLAAGLSTYRPGG